MINKSYAGQPNTQETQAAIMQDVLGQLLVGSFVPIKCHDGSEITINKIVCDHTNNERGSDSIRVDLFGTRSVPVDYIDIKFVVPDAPAENKDI
jgi:hypothetical protein